MRMPEGEGGVLRSSLLYGTVGGALGAIAAISEEEYQFFLALQHQLSKVLCPCRSHHFSLTPRYVKVVRGVGGFTHDQWRAFSNERKNVPSRGFIDGDLVERFLDLKPAQQAQIGHELSLPAEEIARRVESISQALH